MRPYSLTLLIYPASAGYSVTVSTQYVNELLSDLSENVKCVRLLSDRVFPERRCSSRTFRYGYLVTT